MGPRNIYLSLIAMMAILLPGILVFQGSDAGTQAVGIAAFGGGLAVLHVLDARQRRREGRG